MTTVNRTSDQDAPTLLTPRILIPFLVCTLIWGSTWIVIRGQLGTVPVTWSVAYRFAIAATAMVVLALVRGKTLRMSRTGHVLALILGLTQFVGNFNFVYSAEHYVTSGLVAVLFSLLIIPNSLLARLFLGNSVSRRFLVGASIAILGVGAMILHEYREASVGPGAVLAGIGFTLCGILAASIANVMQGAKAARAQEMTAMLAWAMGYGALFNAGLGYAISGPPVIDTGLAYLAGVAYLGVIASAVTFPLYFGVVREVGPGQAAWVSVLVPIIAMLISTLVESYVWSPLSIAGAILAATGLVIAVRARSPRPVVSANMTPVSVDVKA